MIYIRNTISKISFSYIMYISIILCRNYLQIVRSNYVYFGQINESVCLSVCLIVIQLFSKYDCMALLLRAIKQDF